MRFRCHQSEQFTANRTVEWMREASGYGRES
jgi:hypothetical protein